VTHELIVNGAPDPPEVTLTAQTTDSVTIKIKAKNPEDKTPVHGYTLHYKPDLGDWDTAAIPYGSEEFSLDNLLCGQKYQLYVVAYNE
jgi:Down syndrome cell adhesion protein 1